jgi:hypothetical protein
MSDDHGKSYKYSAASYSSDGNNRRNIGGNIMPNCSEQRIKRLFSFTYTWTTTKRVRWGTSEKKNMLKRCGIVFSLTT